MIATMHHKSRDMFYINEMVAIYLLVDYGVKEA